MKRRFGLGRISLVGVAPSVALLTLAVGTAWAESLTTLCVKNAANGTVKGPTVPGGNACKTGYNAVQLPGAGELETLNKILPHIRYVEAGVGGKPTIQFSGVNVQLVNGEGKTASVNGEGNLVLGYDEEPGTQTGSSNLVVGIRQSFTSFGAILGGESNAASGEYDVAFGAGNTASGKGASVAGGTGNKAAGRDSSVSAGSANSAEGQGASVSGGINNTAGLGQDSSVSGGSHNLAEGEDNSVSGGVNNRATGNGSSVSGGAENKAQASTCCLGETSISGGYKNTANGNRSSIFGGKELTTTGEYEAIP
jgi:trimeric autotransporter adhesin